MKIETDNNSRRARHDGWPELTWLGINGWRLHYGDTTVLIDPYFSHDSQRLSIPEVVASHKKYIADADAILISHSHWDHLADIAAVADITGAKILGSLTTVNICRSFGVGQERLTTIAPGRSTHNLGPGVTVTFIPSLHTFNNGKSVAYAGLYESVPDHPPASAPEYLEGGTSALLIECGDFRLLNLGTANYIAPELKGLDVDVLIFSIARTYALKNYLEGLFGLVHAHTLIPCHFDNYNAPLGTSLHPHLNVPETLDLVRELSPEIRLLVPEVLAPARW